MEGTKITLTDGKVSEILEEVSKPTHLTKDIDRHVPSLLLNTAPLHLPLGPNLRVAISAQKRKVPTVGE